MEASLQEMKRTCAILNDRLWKVRLHEEEEFDHTASKNGQTLVFTTKDGFTIKIVFQTGYSRYFNGYVTIPESFLDIGLDHDRVEHVNFSQEITYHDFDRQTFGWDHHHYYDGDLSISEENQVTGRILSGPVQVLEEARELIDEIRRRRQQKIQERMAILEEELMRKACHPLRIQQWTEQGFDPFMV